MPSPGPAPGRIARGIILLLLIAAPLAFGSVQEVAFIPLLALCACAGALSWLPHARQHGLAATAPTGTRFVLAWMALIVFQTLPLPPSVLALLSPGTYAFHARLSLVPVTTWYPISLNPADSARGLAFVAGFFLLFAAVEREAEHRHWRRHVVWVIVGTGCFMTVEALVQASSATPSAIYGRWRPLTDWAVFGPYVNRNHFANYLVMATPLSLALLIEALADLSAAWHARRWLAWGDPPGTRTLLRTMLTLTLLVGLLAARSRASVGASLVALVLLALVLRSSRRVALVLILLVLATVWFVDPGPFLESLHARSFAQTRWPLWKDALAAVPHFPVFGAGFNAYGTLSPHYQTSFLENWIDQPHNEYLGVLVDTGLIGVVAVGGLIVLLARRALSAAGHSTLGAGLFAALAACALNNLLDFGWQIPANAATFVALAALTAREGRPRHRVSVSES